MSSAEKYSSTDQDPPPPVHSDSVVEKDGEQFYDPPQAYYNNNGEDNGEPVPLNDPEMNDTTSALSHQLSRVMSRPDTRERLESLSRVMSTRTKQDGKLEIDPEDFDLRVILEAIKNKTIEQGSELSKTGISFRGLTVEGVDASASYGPSVSELIRSIVTLPKTLMSMRNPPLRNIIEGFDGVVEAGEMLLVLGRPGAGCSSFLKTIAGEVDQFKGVHGELLYDGASQDDMLKHFKDEVIYNAEREYKEPPPQKKKKKITNSCVYI